MFWIANVLAVFALAVLLSGVMIPQILLIAFRKKLFDEPDERKIHTSVVPRLGGIAFVPVMMVSMALLLGIDMTLNVSMLTADLMTGAKTVTFCFSALMILFIVGMADDLIGVRYRAKFVAQILCAALLICAGLSIDSFHGFLWIHAIPWWIAWPFTILLAVFIINAINLIDGIDGLASGLSSVALITYGTVFFMAGEYICAMIAAATLGVLVQFFYYNVFGNPTKQKKIFMGDTGSLSIGLILCILSFRILNIPETHDLKSVNMLLVAMSPLVIPCFDVIRVYFYRIRHGRNPFLPDKNHIHHKLLALGMTQRIAMLTIIGASVSLTVFNTVLSWWLNVNLVVAIDVAVWITAMLIIPKYIRRHARQIREREQELAASMTDEIDYKQRETQNVIEYLNAREGEVLVDDIVKNVDVEKLRIYAIIFRLKRDGYLRVTRTDAWGADEAVERTVSYY